MDLVDKIMEYENGELNDVQSVEFFQGLIDANMLGSLQGHYGRTAKSLIEKGLCHLPGRKT